MPPNLKANSWGKVLSRGKFSKRNEAGYLKIDLTLVILGSAEDRKSHIRN